MADAAAAYCRHKHMPSDPREHMTAMANLILALGEAEQALNKLLDTF
jgi:hypothetical protein